jgi:hypothetical protein
MGIREIRFCDLTGSEHDVESHELNIDQMRVQIDLAGPEYRKLLGLLQPYIDAGRVDASIPDLRSAAKRSGGSAQVSTSTGLTAEEREQLRQWAEEKGIEVPSNNRFKRSLVEQWREETAADRSA